MGNVSSASLHTAFLIAHAMKKHLFRRLLDGLYLLSGLIAAGFLVAIFLLMLGLSFGRQVGINIPDGTDFVAWCLAASSFLGLAHTFKSGDMIRVGLLLERFHGRQRQAMELLALAVSTAFIGYFAWFAVGLTIDSWRFNDMSQGVLSVPLWIPQLGFSLGLTILLIALLDEIVNVARGNHPTYEKAPPDESPEEMVERIAGGGTA